MTLRMGIELHQSWIWVTKHFQQDEGEITLTGASFGDRPMKVTKEDGKWQMEQTEAGEVSGIVSGGENKITMEDYPSNWIINGTWKFSKSGNKCQINHLDDKDLTMYWKC